METEKPAGHRTGLEHRYVWKQNKSLRCGYTTGTCAAAAAKGAAYMLFSQKAVTCVELVTPDQTRLSLQIEESDFDKHQAFCGVRKDGGDDPDVTNGLLICARVARNTEGQIQIRGGSGIGRVTQEGLSQPVGEAAINRVPRQMIRDALLEVCEELGEPEGLTVTISAPGGEEIAKKTFNPRLGIQGGISILGTSGIVVPMSEEALVASIRVEMEMRRAAGEPYLVITPGNYGENFLREHLALEGVESIKCSNFVGETVDLAAELGFRGILFGAHVGKFVKVSGGIMNTHSRNSDSRAELMAAQALRAGADAEAAGEVLASITTEEALEILEKRGLVEKTMEEMLARIRYYLQERCKGVLETEAILFSNRQGYLGQTRGATEMLEKLRKMGEEKKV